MTTLTWIHVVAGLIMGTLALIHFTTMRRRRQTLTRQSLSGCIWQLLVWMPFVFFFAAYSDWVISFMFFATLVAIYLPDIVWILKLPKDDHAA